MKKLLIATSLALTIVGCKSVEVERHAQTLATWCDTNGVYHAFCDATGKPIIIDGGWEVDYFQHWNWQRFDALTASAGPGVTLTLNGYEGGANATNLTSIIAASFEGGAHLATAIGDAYVKIAGGGAQADAAMSTVAKIYKAFTAQGGDASKATVTTSGDKIKVSDGETCVECDSDGNCEPCKP